VHTSVILCTHNRASSLQNTLEALGRMAAPPDLKWELLIVDNNSDDNTRQIVDAFTRSSDLNVRYLWEPRPGKCLALNTGIEHARGEILGFLDDDILPEKDWLVVIRREFSTDPSLGLITGRVELYDPTDLPMTIRRHAERSEIKTVDQVFDLPTGCNFAVRRELADRVGPFDPEFGPGGKFWSADDLDFFYRAWRAGEKLAYDPSLFVLHAHGRKTPEQGLRLRRDYIMSRGAFYAKHTLRRDKPAAKAMYWELNWWWENRKSTSGQAWLWKGFAAYVLARIHGFFANVLGARYLV
jgi:glycosyltransferase involved in cell wall biosynthesis